MRLTRSLSSAAVFTLLLTSGYFLALMSAVAQAPGGQGKGKAGQQPAQAKGRTVPTGGGGSTAYPQRVPAAPEILARGKALYVAQCGFCHGEDARGGEGASNLIRSTIILNDEDGELLSPVIRDGFPAQGMPKFVMTGTQVSDIAAFLHSFRVNGYDGSRNRPATIVVGDAKAGQTYFEQTCASCHSMSGPASLPGTNPSDLRGIATRITDARTLQQRWLVGGGGGRGGGGTPVTVTVTVSAKEKFEGRLTRIDDFIVTVMQTDGVSKTFARDGDTPKVEIHDPQAAHKDLLKVYTDKNIHDVTAYLVTLK
ncbi:MAG: c-type cytochrome [Acidobacteriota bacterium]